MKKEFKIALLVLVVVGLVMLWLYKKPKKQAATFDEQTGLWTINK